MSSRRRKRRRERRAAPGGLVERVWEQLTDPRTPGLLLLLSGVVLVSSPWSRQPEPLALSWWESAVNLPDALSVAAGLAAAATVLLLGVLLNRYHLATGAPKDTESGEDARFESRSKKEVRESRVPGFAWAGAISMVAGIALVVGYWFVSQRQVPAARVALAVGETIDNYQVPRGGQGLKVMLPSRVRLATLKAGDDAAASIQIFGVAEEPPKPANIAPGQGIEVDGYRFTFIGLRPDVTKLRAVLSSDKPDTIGSSATEGETFKLSLDGQEYKVVEIARNYLGMLGPAVKVESPEHGEFWVFQRASQAEVAPEFGHDIQLDRVETTPAAIFSVARSMPFWPLSAGGTLFVVGFALLILFPERIVRREERDVRIWSFNEAGRVAEQTLEHLEETSGRAS